MGRKSKGRLSTRKDRDERKQETIEPSRLKEEEEEEELREEEEEQHEEVIVLE